MAFVETISSGDTISQSFATINSNFSLLQEKLNSFLYSVNGDTTLETLSTDLYNINMRISDVYEHFNKNLISQYCCTRISPLTTSIVDSINTTVNTVYIVPHLTKNISLFNFDKDEWVVYELDKHIALNLTNLLTNTVYNVGVGVSGNNIIARLVDSNQQELFQNNIPYYLVDNIFLRKIGSIRTNSQQTLTYNTENNFNINIYNLYNKINKVVNFTNTAYFLTDKDTYDIDVSLYFDNTLYLNNKEVLNVLDQDTIEGNFTTKTKCETIKGYNTLRFNRELEQYIEKGQITVTI